MSGYNYYQSQIRKLSDSDFYRIKITSDDGETHWMNIYQSQLDRIADILAEGNDVRCEL